MSYQFPPLGSLRAFEAAARHLSFKKAAEELHVTPAAISHQVKALEEYLSVKLFHRLTRALELTEVAEAMLPKVREGFACLAAAIERTRRHKEGGSLVVSAPPGFAARWLLPRLHSFRFHYPNIELHLTSSLKTIDSSARDRPGADVVDLRDEASDVSIRFGGGRYPGFCVDPIFSPSYVAACSPRLLGGAHPLRTLQDLAHHTLIHDDSIPDEAERPNWEEWLKMAGVINVEASRGLHFSNAVLALGAAMDGLGVVLALKPFVTADVAEGRLCMPFDIAAPSRYAFYLVTPEALADRPSVVAFREWMLVEGAREAL
jgi:LysR family transcriptional regulator, glycine cleavage system transcriptional activator